MGWNSLTAAQQDDLLRRPFDHFGRYRLAAELVTMTVGPDARVLDLGGGPGSLQAFLPDADVTSTDLVLPGKWHAQAPDLVLADGARLPFADRSFDMVVSLDTLEHVVPDDRDRFIAEVSRVADRFAVVVCPYDTPGVADADQALREYVANRFAPDMPTIRILDEHLGYGHPSLEHTRSSMAVHGDVSVLPSGRLDRWFAGMITFFHLLALADDEPVEVTQRFLNRTYYEADLAEPSYRHAVLLRREGATGPPPAEVVSALRERAQADPAADADLDLLRVILSESLADLVTRARTAQQEAEQQSVALASARDLASTRAEDAEGRAVALAEQIASADAQVAVLQEQLSLVTAERDELRAFRDRVVQHPAWRARGKLLDAVRSAADRARS